jgi:hypothetical protein
MSKLYCIANDQGLVKFGFSADPSARLRALQTGSADPLFLVETVDCGSRDVREMERVLHSEFHHLRVRGEWFRCSPEEGARYLRWFEIRYL